MGLESAHAAQPAVVVGSLALEELQHLGVGKDQEGLVGDRGQDALGDDHGLEDRAGRDPAFLGENVTKFLEAARKRPEIASASSTFLPSVPQVFIDVDRDKVLKQGVDLTQVVRIKLD